jgi:hypothetical protein
MNNTATGRSVTCNGVRCPNTDTCGPNGMNANAVIAGMVEMIGAIKYTGRSTPAGTMASLSASLIPSARLCR